MGKGRRAAQGEPDDASVREYPPRKPHGPISPAHVLPALVTLPWAPPDHRSPRAGPASTSSSQASNSNAQCCYWDSPLQCQPKPSDRSTNRLPPSTAASICSGLILRVREGNRPVPIPCHLSTKHSRSHVEKCVPLTLILFTVIYGTFFFKTTHFPSNSEISKCFL